MSRISKITSSLITIYKYLVPLIIFYLLYKIYRISVMNNLWMPILIVILILIFIWIFAVYKYYLVLFFNKISSLSYCGMTINFDTSSYIDTIILKLDSIKLKSTTSEATKDNTNQSKDFEKLEMLLQNLKTSLKIQPLNEEDIEKAYDNVDEPAKHLPTIEKVTLKEKLIPSAYPSDKDYKAIFIPRDYPNLYNVAREKWAFLQDREIPSLIIEDDDGLYVAIMR